MLSRGLLCMRIPWLVEEWGLEGDAKMWRIRQRRFYARRSA